MFTMNFYETDVSINVWSQVAKKQNTLDSGIDVGQGINVVTNLAKRINVE